MIALVSDHAGFEYKEKLKTVLGEMNLPCRDFGTTSGDPTDYTDWAHEAAQAMSSGECDRGIFVCATGVGMSIVANKHKGVRAAVCESAMTARLARQHNDINVLAVGQRLTNWESVVDIVKTFLTTPFEGGRHKRRVDKIHSLTGL